MSMLKDIDSIPDSGMRKAVAQMTVQYWEAVAIEAAKKHPNWTVAEDGTAKWLGRRTGPRTFCGLLNWFMKNHRDETRQVFNRIHSAILFPKLSSNVVRH